MTIHHILEVSLQVFPLPTPPPVFYSTIFLALPTDSDRALSLPSPSSGHSSLSGDLQIGCPELSTIFQIQSAQGQGLGTLDGILLFMKPKIASINFFLVFSAVRQWHGGGLRRSLGHLVPRCFVEFFFTVRSALKWGEGSITPSLGILCWLELVPQHFGEKRVETCPQHPEREEHRQTLFKQEVEREETSEV